MDKRIVYCFLILTTLISLKVESVDEIVNKTDDNLWIQDIRLSGDNSILLNSFASSNRLSLSGINSWITIDSNDVYEGCINFSYYLGNSVSKKIPITDDLFAWYLDTVLIFNSTRNFSYIYLPTFRLSQLGSGIKHFGIASINRKNECLSISKSLHCLVPVTTIDNNQALYLIKPNIALNNRDEVDLIVSTKNALIHKVILNVASQSRIISLYTAFDKFFVSMTDNLYCIDTTGNVKMILDAPNSQVISKSDSLFAISNNGNVYMSSDKGENWSVYCEVAIDASNLKLVSIDNSIIAYPYLCDGHMYKIDIGNHSMSIDTLASGGLKDKDITSVSEFRGRVYVTTISGLFYKDLKNLRKK